MTRWTQHEIARLDRGVDDGESYRQIADALGRTVCSVKCFARKRGLIRRRRWSEVGSAFLRSHYKRARTATIAACLGRSPGSIHQHADALGLSEPPNCAIRDNHDTWRRLYELGWSDAEIAKELGVTRESVRNYRERRGFPANGRNERYRRRVAETTRRQAEAAGVTSLSEVRTLAFRRFALDSGWPEDLRPRAVQILNLLYDNGPMTRRQLSDAMGMVWKGSRKSLVSNDPEGSYLAHLVNRGLVVNLGKVVKGKGSGYSVCKYAIPPHVVRGNFSTFQ